MTTITARGAWLGVADLAARICGALSTQLHARRAEALPASGCTADAAELRELRAYAQEVMHHDPRFAADLFAAADRHEQQKR